MKKFGLIIGLGLALASCQSKNSGGTRDLASGDSTAAPYMYFKEESHDLGKVAEGEKVAYTFTVENRGKTDLLLKDVQTSCGCTVAKYENHPIASGKTGTIELLLNTSGKNGHVTKTAKVMSNAKPDMKILTIKCEVLPK
jgi:hypothetical protein